MFGDAFALLAIVFVGVGVSLTVSCCHARRKEERSTRRGAPLRLGTLISSHCTPSGAAEGAMERAASSQALLFSGTAGVGGVMGEDGEGGSWRAWVVAGELGSLRSPVPVRHTSDARRPSMMR